MIVEDGIHLPDFNVRTVTIHKYVVGSDILYVIQKESEDLNPPNLPMCYAVGMEQDEALESGVSHGWDRINHRNKLRECTA